MGRKRKIKPEDIVLDDDEAIHELEKDVLMHEVEENEDDHYYHLKEDETEEDIDEEVEKDVIPVKKPKIDKTKYYIQPKEFDDEIMKYYGNGIISDELARMMEKIANKLSFSPNFINYCVDDSTEALTKRGWLKGKDIKPEKDEILSYDIEKKTLVWSTVKNLNRFKYDGLMHKLTNEGLDALVTPHHKFVSEERGLVEVDHIVSKEHIVLTGNPENSVTEKRYSDKFVELVGWAVTEGHYKKGKRTFCVEIFQKKGPKCDKIRKCLDDLEAKYKEYNWNKKGIVGYRITKSVATDIFSVSSDKIPTMEFISALTPDQRLILIQTMIDGDGTTNISKTGKISKFYYQKCKKNMDAFVTLCTLSGLTTSTEKKKVNTPFGISEYYTTYIYETPKTSCFVENINFYGGKPKAGGYCKGEQKEKIGKKGNPNIPTEQYKGFVWCPETEHGTFVCRRGRYVYVTGNSFKDDMIGDAIVKMMKALIGKKYQHNKGSNPFSYFTRIAFNSFICRIKKEKHSQQIHEKYRDELLMFAENYNTIVKNKNIKIVPM